MGLRFRAILVPGLGTLALLAACSLTLLAAAPLGWFLAGTKPASYDSGIDLQAAYGDHPAAYLKSKDLRIEGFGTLMQDFHAGHYLGKRVRFSAFVRSQDVADWAGLWMRIDHDSQSVAFDNMQNRAIKGATDWQKYEVVLDVPSDATGIFFGILLSGTGEVWISNAKFEVVGSDVPTTSASNTSSMPEEPANLNFEADHP